MTAALYLSANGPLLQESDVVQTSGQNLDEGWGFHLGDAPGGEAEGFPTDDWEEVSLSHSARMEARVTNVTDHRQWEGVCLYRKRLHSPASTLGQTVRVRLQGAMNRVRLYANGWLISENTDGYLPLVGDLI